MSGLITGLGRTSHEDSLGPESADTGDLLRLPILVLPGIGQPGPPAWSLYRRPWRAAPAELYGGPTTEPRSGGDDDDDGGSLRRYWRCSGS